MDNNKFDISTSWGDTDPSLESEADNHADREQDGSGVPNVNMGECTYMEMALEPNKFPREKGHDSLAGDEVIYS